MKNKPPPRLMGILNVTPDSFSDGGRYVQLDDALARAEQMVNDGADLIDIGGESTRPGASPVPLEVELKRVIPVVQYLKTRCPRVPLSIDTSKAEVARQALEEGASLINDVSALRDPWMPVVLRDHSAPVILMHMRGDPRTMQTSPVYGDVVVDVAAFFEERLAFAAAQGLPRERFLLDPGFGFGKSTEHNLTLLRRLSEFNRLGRPLVVGVSQKSFIGRLLGTEDAPLPPKERGNGTLAAQLWAAAQGAAILRVHDVKAAAQSLALWRAVAESGKIGVGEK